MGAPRKPNYIRLEIAWREDRSAWLHAGESNLVRALLERAEWLEDERQRLMAELRAAS